MDSSANLKCFHWLYRYRPATHEYPGSSALQHQKNVPVDHFQIPFAFLSCTGVENNICCTNPGALPPGPRHKSGTLLEDVEVDVG